MAIAQDQFEVLGYYQEERGISMWICGENKLTLSRHNLGYWLMWITIALGIVLSVYIATQVSRRAVLYRIYGDDIVEKGGEYFYSLPTVDLSIKGVSGDAIKDKSEFPVISKFMDEDHFEFQRGYGNAQVIHYRIGNTSGQELQYAISIELWNGGNWITLYNPRYSIGGKLKSNESITIPIMLFYWKNISTIDNEYIALSDKPVSDQSNVLLISPYPKGKYRIVVHCNNSYFADEFQIRRRSNPALGKRHTIPINEYISPD